MKRYTLSSSFLGVVLSAKIAFSKRSWPYLAAAAVPWLLCAGQRCVTRLAGLSCHRRSLSGYYRFLSDGKWRMEVLFRSLFDLVVRTFRITDLVLVLDDPGAPGPKWGRGIFGTAFHFDHTARPRPGYIWGHNWVVLAVVVQVGNLAWAALPFWVALYRPKKTCPRGQFRTRHEMAAEAAEAVRWEKVEAYLEKMGSGALYKRLGLLVEMLGEKVSVPDRQRRIEAWRSRLTGGYAPLDTGGPASGPVNSRWRVRVNVPALGAGVQA